MGVWKPLPPQALRGALLEQSDDRGAMQMYLPQPSLLVTRVRGYMAHAMADAWVRATAPVWKPGVRLRVFNDWDLMEGYESSARQLLTSWVLDHRAQFDSARFCTSSRLVAMGVAVANTATTLAGVTMHASTTRALFEAELARQLG